MHLKLLDRKYTRKLHSSFDDILTKPEGCCIMIPKPV